MLLFTYAGEQAVNAQMAVAEIKMVQPVPHNYNRWNYSPIQ